MLYIKLFEATVCGIGLFGGLSRIRGLNKKTAVQSFRQVNIPKVSLLRNHKHIIAPSATWIYSDWCHLGGV